MMGSVQGPRIASAPALVDALDSQRNDFAAAEKLFRKQSRCSGIARAGRLMGVLLLRRHSDSIDVIQLIH